MSEPVSGGGGGGGVTQAGNGFGIDKNTVTGGEDFNEDDISLNAPLTDNQK